MRARDVLILFVAGLAIMLSLKPTGELGIERSFMEIQDSKVYQNPSLPTNSERLPAPIIEDVDNDGFPEIIVVQHKPPSIKVLDASEVGNPQLAMQYFGMTSLEAKATVSPVSAVGLETGRKIVALRHGYLTAPMRFHRAIVPPLAPPTRARKHYLCAVTADGSVLLYEAATLQLVWESSIIPAIRMDSGDSEEDIDTVTVDPTSQSAEPKENLLENGRITISEVNIILSHHSVYKSDRGMVVVAAKVKTKYFSEETQTEMESLLAKGEHCYFAFDGLSGSLRWDHTLRSQVIEEQSRAHIPQHNHKLTVYSHETHSGEVNWRHYRADLLSHLPHRWVSDADSHMKLAHFSTKRNTRTLASKRAARSQGKLTTSTRPMDLGSTSLSATAENQTHLTGTPHGLAGNGLGLTGSGSGLGLGAWRLLPGVSGGGVQPFEKDELVHRPNVIVSYTESGIEVLHLYTGRILTSLSLSPHSAYYDVNHDGWIDRVNSVVKDSGTEALLEAKRGKRCVGEVRSGLPAVETLYDLPTCTAKRSVGGYSEIFQRLFEVSNDLHSSVDTSVHLYRDEREGERVEREMEGIEGVEMEAEHDEHTGVNTGALEGAVPVVVTVGNSDAPLTFMIFAFSDGTVSAFTGAGRLFFRTRTHSTWNTQEFVRPTSAAEGDLPAFAPVVHPFSLISYGTPDHLLIVGDRIMTIMTLGGEVVAETQVYAHPVNNAQFTDFNSDGYTDIVVQTRLGVFGFAVQKHSSTSALSLLLFGFLVLMGALFASQQIARYSLGAMNLSESGIIGSGGARRVKKVFADKRATD